MQSTETYTRIGHGQCDQCSLCTELCPRYIMGYPIEPHRVMRTLLMTGEAKQRGSLWAQYCCECNVCSYIACPEQTGSRRTSASMPNRSCERTSWAEAKRNWKLLFRDPHPARRGREIPIKTLYTRLGLTAYDRKADFRRFDDDTAAGAHPAEFACRQARANRRFAWVTRSAAGR